MTHDKVGNQPCMWSISQEDTETHLGAVMHHAEGHLGLRDVELVGLSLLFNLGDVLFGSRNHST